MAVDSRNGDGVGTPTAPRRERERAAGFQGTATIAGGRSDLQAGAANLKENTPTGPKTLKIYMNGPASRSSTTSSISAPPARNLLAEQNSVISVVALSPPSAPRAMTSSGHYTSTTSKIRPHSSLSSPVNVLNEASSIFHGSASIASSPPLREGTDRGFQERDWIRERDRETVTPDSRYANGYGHTYENDYRHSSSYAASSSYTSSSIREAEALARSALSKANLPHPLPSHPVPAAPTHAAKPKLAIKLTSPAGLHTLRPVYAVKTPKGSARAIAASYNVLEGEKVPSAAQAPEDPRLPRALRAAAAAARLAGPTPSPDKGKGRSTLTYETNDFLPPLPTSLPPAPPNDTSIPSLPPSPSSLNSGVHPYSSAQSSPTPPPLPNPSLALTGTTPQFSVPIQSKSLPRDPRWPLQDEPAPLNDSDKVQPPPPPLPLVTPITPPPPLQREKNFYIIYDPTLDNSVVKKGNRSKKRMEGEGASRPVVDPRLKKGDYASLLAKRHRPVDRVTRLSYEYDRNSTGPPPPPLSTAILITNLNRLTTIEKVLSYFTAYGRICENEFKTDPKTGGSIGICWIKYADDAARIVWTKKGKEKRPAGPGGQDGHLVALDAIERNNGQKVVTLCGPEGKIMMQLDWDGKLCKKAVAEELERRYPKPSKSILANEARTSLVGPSSVTLSSTARTSDRGSASAEFSITSKLTGAASLPKKPPMASTPTSMLLSAKEVVDTRVRTLPSAATFTADDVRISLRSENPLSRSMPYEGEGYFLRKLLDRRKSLTEPTDASRSAHDLPNTPKSSQYTNKISTLARQPYKLPTLRSPDRKGKGRDSNFDSSSSESDSTTEDGDEFSSREDEDKVFFPRTGNGGRHQRVRSDLTKQADQVIEDLKAKIKAWRRLADQQKPYIAIMKGDLIAWETHRHQKISQSYVRGHLGRHNPVEVS